MATNWPEYLQKLKDQGTYDESLWADEDVVPLLANDDPQCKQLIFTNKDYVMRSVTIKDAVNGADYDISEADLVHLTTPDLVARAKLRRRAVPVEVSHTVLLKVVAWLEHHKGDPLPTPDDETDSRKKSTDIDEWDQKFMQVDQEMLFELILAANFLDIKQFLDVGCKTVANMIKGKSPEEIRKTFNIQNDFTPEEEEQIRRENEWAEDR